LATVFNLHVPGTKGPTRSESRDEGLSSVGGILHVTGEWEGVGNTPQMRPGDTSVFSLLLQLFHHSAKLPL